MAHLGADDRFNSLVPGTVIATTPEAGRDGNLANNGIK
jgi:hypothetical protein